MVVAVLAEVAADSVEEAAAVNPNVEFYQRLLAAELSVTKRQAILKDLGASPSVSALLTHSALSSAERERAKSANLDLLAKAQQHGVNLLSGDDMPRLMREAPGASPALFCWGRAEVLREPCIAIVGTRQASTYGKAVAQKFAEAFARAGVAVVSGGAFGIDAAAHKGALAASGNTAAVLLTGIERTYPTEHRGLFQQIRSNG
ncbi:MAG TPA: DNA-processing protein DprA [Fimbriimonadaceae bacterium]|nr:DNA-processing protein DprA [Fimbriimonadaceae bacterium]